MQIIGQVRALWARQWYVTKDSLFDMVINHVILWPALFSVSQGYFIPLSFFPHEAAEKGTELMLGMVLLQAFVVAYFALVELLNDRDETGILHYHGMATSYPALFFSRLSFYIIQTYCVLIPFLPMTKLFLGSYFITSQVHWLSVLGIVFLIATTVVSYIFCLFCCISAIRELEYAWTCGVEPFLWLSGMWAAPYAIAKSNVPGMSWFLAINPFAYATDAIRQLFFHDTRFQPVSTCCFVMIGATILFTLLAYHLLKRRLQAV